MIQEFYTTFVREALKTRLSDDLKTYIFPCPVLTRESPLNFQMVGKFKTFFVYIFS